MLFEMRIALCSPYGQKFFVIIIVAEINDMEFWVRRIYFACSNLFSYTEMFFSNLKIGTV